MSYQLDVSSDLPENAVKIRTLVQSYRALAEQNAMLNAQMTDDAKEDERKREEEELEEGINDIIDKVKQSFKKDSVDE